jgi:hypothetical protein
VRKPTARHCEIAEIAKNLGANVTARDVLIINEATRVEYENRTDRPAAGGRAKHDPDVWGGLRKEE